MMSELHQTQVVLEIGDFKLEQHDLIGGAPIFYLPKRNGVICSIADCEVVEAFTYCFSPTPLHGIPVLPCSVVEWDAYALCLFNGKLGSATAAFGFDGANLDANRLGWFSRWADRDLRWEYTVE